MFDGLPLGKIWLQNDIFAFDGTLVVRNVEITLKITQSLIAVASGRGITSVCEACLGQGFYEAQGRDITASEPASKILSFYSMAMHSCVYTTNIRFINQPKSLK